MGGLLFILSVASIVERVQELYEDVTIVGLADDYRFVGPVDAAMDAAAMYKTEVEAAGEYPIILTPNPRILLSWPHANSGHPSHTKPPNPPCRRGESDHGAGDGGGDVAAGGVARRG